MRKIKLLLLLLTVLIFTGCSCDYKVTINDDFSVEEKARITLNSSDGALEKLEKLKEENPTEYTSFSIDDDGEKITVDFSAKYSSVEMFLVNSVLYNELFDNKSIKDNTDNLALEAEATLKNDYDKSMKNVTNAFDIDDIKITLITNLNLDTNAQTVEGNNYIWRIGKNTEKLPISISIATSAVSYNFFPIIFASIIFIVLILVVIFYIRFNRKQY